MEEQGIIVDVSHLSDAGFWDVAAITKNPFVASHSNARSICPHKRNLSDAQIRTIGERGGVIGLNFADDFLEKDPTNLTWDSFIRNIKHMIKMGGEDVLALGSDFDGIPTNPLIPHAGAVPCLFEVMEQNGIPASVIDKMAGANALRVMKEVLK
jgi:membrane dipeptidase